MAHFSINNCYYKCTEAVNKLLWLQMARMDMDYSLKKIRINFLSCLQASLKNDACFSL